MEALETQEVGQYTVEVHYDEMSAQDGAYSREWDNLGTIAGCTDWTFSEDDRSYSTIRATEGPVIALPLRVDDYGSNGTRIYATDWEGADGIYWATFDKVREEWGTIDADTIRNALECMKGEIRTLDQCLQGDIYSYSVVDDSGDVVESCCGYVGEPDYTMAEGVSVAEWLTFKDACDWASVPEWVRETVLAHQ